MFERYTEKAHRVISFARRGAPVWGAIYWNGAFAARAVTRK